MAQTFDTICIFTRAGLTQLASKGRSGRWVVDVNRARKCKYLLVIQNRASNEPDATPSAPHGTAFMIAKIKDVVEAEARPGDKGKRYTVLFDEYAELPNIEGQWEGLKNPVRYIKLPASIDPDRVTFRKIGQTSQQEPPQAAPSLSGDMTQRSSLSLDMNAAKKALARHYGVEPEAIEIVIRG